MYRIKDGMCLVFFKIHFLTSNGKSPFCDVLAIEININLIKASLYVLCLNHCVFYKLIFEKKNFKS